VTEIRRELDKMAHETQSRMSAGCPPPDRGTMARRLLECRERALAFAGRRLRCGACIQDREDAFASTVARMDALCARGRFDGRTEREFWGIFWRAFGKEIRKAEHRASVLRRASLWARPVARVELRPDERYWDICRLSAEVADPVDRELYES